MSAYHALIIDDKLTNIDVLAMLLEREGVDFTAVTISRHVLATIEEIERIDVVFLDLEMPNGDYRQVLSQLKANPRLAGVPIIAYTVHTSEIDAARRVGFDGFLGKPLQVADFPKHLRRIMNGESVWVY
jgi:two-component system, cell cycle response regulator DivK